MTSTLNSQRTRTTTAVNAERKIRTLTLDLTCTCFCCPSRTIVMSSDSDTVTLHCGRLAKDVRKNLTELDIMLLRRPHECPRNIKEESKAK